MVETTSWWTSPNAPARPWYVPPASSNADMFLRPPPHRLRPALSWLMASPSPLPCLSYSHILNISTSYLRDLIFCLSFIWLLQSGLAILHATFFQIKTIWIQLKSSGLLRMVNWQTDSCLFIEIILINSKYQNIQKVFRGCLSVCEFVSP